VVSPLLLPGTRRAYHAQGAHSIPVHSVVNMQGCNEDGCAGDGTGSSVSFFGTGGAASAVSSSVTFFALKLPLMLPVPSLVASFSRRC